MIEPRTEELINAELDEELTPQELDELHGRLDASAEARDLRLRLLRVHNLLEAMPAQEFPSSLHERITTTVDLPAPAPMPRGARLAWLAPVRYGLAASFGVALGVLGLMAWSPTMTDSDYDQLRGTIAPHGPVARTEIAHEDITARVALTSSGGRSELALVTDSAQPVDVAIDLGDTGLHLIGIEPTGEALERLSVSGRQVRLRTLGQRRYLFVFSPAAGANHPIHIEIARDERTLVRRAIAID